VNEEDEWKCSLGVKDGPQFGLDDGPWDQKFAMDHTM
jgi:hypothetical protein